MENTLTKQIIARAITDTVLHMLETNSFDFTELVSSEGAEIACEIHAVLNKYGYKSNHGFNEFNDFKAIEDIIHIFEEHGYTGGTIHKFD